MAQSGWPITLVSSGGMPITLISWPNHGAPVSIVSSGGTPATIVSSGGMPAYVLNPEALPLEDRERWIQNSIQVALQAVGGLRKEVGPRQPESEDMKWPL